MKKDKIFHFLAGAAVIFIALPCYFWGGIASGLWSCLGGIAAGLAKEWSDYQHNCKFDWRDLLATVIGAAAVALFIVLMHYAKG